ncbi:MAG: PQQ-binding-like beta-propeller repeat protein [bacterium]|nr:PQQ-binding-like beta-propeller repeat protein [bacterium]
MREISRRRVRWRWLALAACLLAPSHGHGEDWPQFRGPDGTGISDQAGLLRSWPEGGPEVLWRRPLGEGFAGISVVGERLFTLWSVDGKEVAGGFRVADGSELWRLEVGEKFVDHWGNGPRATPVVEGEVVYSLASGGGLFAVRAADGEVLFKVDLEARFGTPNRPVQFDEGAPTGAVPLGPYWGYCSSPLIEGNLLIVYTGAGDGKSLVALDKRTGETLWRRYDHLTSYTTPVAMTLAGQRQIVVAMSHEIVSVSPSGEPLWRHPWARYNVSQPVLLPPDRLFFSSANDIGALLLRVLRQGDGFEVEEVWREPRMRNNWQSSLGYRDSILGFDNATLKLLAADGATVWAHRGLGKGTLVLADDLLFLLGDRGRITLAEWSTERFVEAGSMQVLGGMTLTSPTVAQGKLFLRNHEEIVCLDLKAPPGQNGGR